MTILFATTIVILLFMGYMARRRQQDRWRAEERYDESGRWLDKRAGERGTFGSLDESREAERKIIARQGRVRELAERIREYGMGSIEGFADQSEEYMRTFTLATRKSTEQILAAAALLEEGEAPVRTEDRPEDEHAQALKKIILLYLFQASPKLADADIDALKKFDAWVGGMAYNLVNAMRKG